MLESISGGFTTIIAFLVMLAILVLVHELGHFLTAVRLGIKVEEFGLGFPPRAKVLFERNGVKYTLNWLPIGGFVRFAGDGNTAYGVGELANAAPWKKILVLVAGPLMNLVLAVAIYAGIFLVRGVPDNGVQVLTIYPGTPAALAGFQTNDLLVALDGQTIGRDLAQIREIAVANSGRAIEAVIVRNGERVLLTVTPGPWRYEDKQGSAGFGFQYGGNPQFVPTDIFTASWLGVIYTVDILGRFVMGIAEALGGLLGVNPPPPGGVVGVVGMARVTGEIINQGSLLEFLPWMALISLNLFLINLLPIPALDGSHIMFALLEMVRRGKKIPPEKEAMVHAFGFMMLMGLMVLITVSDIARWIGGAPALGGS